MTRQVPIEVHRAANQAHFAQAARVECGGLTVSSLPVEERVRARCVHHRAGVAWLVHHVRQVYVVTGRDRRWVMTRFWCGVRSFTTEPVDSDVGPLCLRCLIALPPAPPARSTT